MSGPAGLQRLLRAGRQPTDSQHTGIPVKFSLGGDHGLGVLAPGFPASERVNWRQQGPELLDHHLAVYSEEQRIVFGANTYRAFARMLASSTEESELPLRSHGGLSMNRALMAAGLVDRLQVTLFPVITGQTGLTDGFFLVLAGRLTIQLRDVELGPGELFVVPPCVEHCPKADASTNTAPRGPRIGSAHR